MTLTQLENIRPSARAGQSRKPQALDNCLECPVRSISICSVLNRCELDFFAGIGREANYRPRETLFMEGLKVDAVYNITKGLARLYRLLPSGHRQLVGFAFPGDFIGLPSDERYGFSADAAVATTACRFPRDAFVAFLKGRQDLLRRIHESAVRDLEYARDQMVQLGPRRADAKIAAFLLGMRRRRPPVSESSVLISLPMGRQDIGDYLGLSIATVSRTLHRLERGGLILIVPNGVRVLDRQRLERLANA
jgi:CRP/FNR family transcriptional regulator